MTKKIIIIAIVVVGLLGGMWWIFSRTPEAGVVGEDGLVRRFNPFGIFSNGGGATPPPATTTPETPSAVFVPRMRQISAGPVAGASFAYGTTSEVLIRFIERETGHVFGTSASTTVTQRLTNTTIPRVEEALWNPQGTAVAVRYLRSDGETVETFVAPIPKPKESANGVPAETEQPLVGNIVAPNISSLAWAPDGTEFFAITPASDGSSGTIFDVSGEVKQSVFTSPLREWLASWPTKNTIVLSTKPSSAVRGYAYRLPRSGGELSRIVGGLFGLSVLPNIGFTQTLYTHLSGGRLALKTVDEKTDEVRPVEPATLTEKCAWGSGDVLYCAVPTTRVGGLPDAWYQGTTGTGDALWKIDTVTGTADILLDTGAYADGGIDVVALFVDSADTHLLLINKINGSLWVFRIAP